MTHDPLCQRYEADHWCECDLIARVRADERERVARDEVQIYARAWDEISDEVFQKVNDYDHAEAVAARLVEVICEQDILLREWVAERKRLEPMLAARVDADYCTGCDLPLTRCLAHHAETGGKCCPECQHPAEAQAFATLRAQIAADIEAGCVHGRLVTRDSQTCYRCRHAARIARGGA